MEIDMLRNENLNLLQQLRNGQKMFNRMLTKSKSNTSQNGTLKYSHAENIQAMQYATPLKDTKDIVSGGNSLHDPALMISKMKQSKECRNVIRINHKFCDSFNKDPEYRQVSKTCKDNNYESVHGNTTGADNPPRAPGRANTPRSILKRRKIIDDNIRVESKYQHTPTHKSTKERSLNFSYGEVDELAKPPQDMSGDDANDEENDSEITDVSSLGSLNHLHSASCSSHGLVQDRLLSSPGNDRQNAAIALALSRRPKSAIFDPEASLGRESASLQVAAHSGGSSQLSGRSMLGSEQRPLLGYDWIAGLLDNETSSLMDRPADYFDEIKEFRRVNKAECSMESAFEHIFDATRPISPKVKDPEHTCVHGFVINERLYAEPINPGEDGRSVCPICLIPRHEQPTEEEPGFVRVSIPRSTLMSPYRIQPRHRGSYDPNSMSLAGHCVAGYQTTKPESLPPSSTVDLRHSVNGIHGKLATTLEDATEFVQSYSRAAMNLRPPQGLLKPRQGLLDPDLSLAHLKAGHGETASRAWREGLLDTTNALRFALQNTGQDSLTSGAGNQSTKVYSVL